jgi:hypothetical protein
MDLSSELKEAIPKLYDEKYKKFSAGFKNFIKNALWMSTEPYNKCVSELGDYIR